MRFPSLSRHTEPAPSTAGDDTERSGAVATDTRTTDRVDGRDRTATDQTAEQPADERAAAARAATARSSIGGARHARAAAPTGAPDPDRTVDLDRSADRARTVGGNTTVTPNRVHRDTTVSPDHVADRESTVDRAPAPDTPPAPAGPRPRASLLATLGLIGGLAGLGLVLTGALAGYGIALGAAGAVLAVLGLIATRRRHVAGKSDALLGMAFGVGAVVLGVLAMTGQYDWPTTDGDVVIRLREWLDSQILDRL
ncbi:hypothetical protein Vqi01_36290 [Micromonospora qiuiae]|uniref:Thrombospondin n=1 Tax=Micromonospora qiuiae TaxID=502268 RepID=A0ABQ4JE60_9ACTN|nr:thrombospondin [Micromonospora qiuiae]GIJ28467.1 hypothetical protein Vqi01_36290 [Micromonospora qiuiae]